MDIFHKYEHASSPTLDIRDISFKDSNSKDINSKDLKMQKNSSDVKCRKWYIIKKYSSLKVDLLFSYLQTCINKIYGASKLVIEWYEKSENCKWTLPLRCFMPCQDSKSFQGGNGAIRFKYRVSVIAGKANMQAIFLRWLHVFLIESCDQYFFIVLCSFNVQFFFLDC